MYPIVPQSGRKDTTIFMILHYFIALMFYFGMASKEQKENSL